METFQKFQKWIGFAFGLIAAILAIVMVVMYAGLNKDLKDARNCVAFNFDENQVESDPLNAATFVLAAISSPPEECPDPMPQGDWLKECKDDVNSDWKFILDFGFGIWIVYILLGLLAAASGFNVWIAVVNAILTGCCIGIPMLVQIIMMGIYRLSWWGKYCSTAENFGTVENNTADVGMRMFGVWIMEIVFWCLYNCCTNCSTNNAKAALKRQ